MSSTNERQARARGLAFLAKSQLMSADDVARALWRMAARNRRAQPLDEVVSIIGLQSGGRHRRSPSRVPQRDIGHSVAAGTLDVSFYRDDFSHNPVPVSSATSIDQRPHRPTVVLVDDVLFTGRTIRAALNALSDWGRPRAVQLAVSSTAVIANYQSVRTSSGRTSRPSIDEAIVATTDGVWIGTRESA